MLSGVMLIIVTMFAVLGAYYLSDLLTNCLFRRRKAAEALVVLRADTSEQMWAGVLDARAALPDTAVVVLCPQEDAFTPPGAGMRGVAFATPDTLAQVVQATGERVRKTALAILDQVDTLQVGDGTPPGLERDTPSPRSSRPAAHAVETDRPRVAPVPELVGRGL